MVRFGEFDMLVMLACGAELEHEVEGRELRLVCVKFGSAPVAHSLGKDGENCPAC